ncbi:type II 3-dehydroquinate dehydratase [Candidatus Sumerlaeota bacterium]|nr:type II 3-dehydroquinate dehydratase [Candidatus Sumerlaeota bacterium]
MSKILLINGPNLNLLGTRETDIYGSRTLADIEAEFIEEAAALQLQAETFQSNNEGAIVDRIHQAAKDAVEVIIINPGAYTHTSVAIRDALAGVGISTIEVHLSNIYQREEFRHHSFVAPVAKGQIAGFGPLGYLMALWAARRMIAGS